MTTAKVSQAGAESLFKVTPENRASQAGVEYLHRVGTPMSASQAGAEYLHRVQPTFSISQAGAEILFKNVPCGTQLAQIWTITRTDGEVFRFTSLDRDFEYPPGSGVTYQACDSLVPTASEAVSEVDAAGNMDLSGALGTITEHDLYAGLFDGAEVEAWLVPWDGAGSRKLLLSGTFGAVEQTPTGFKVEVLGDGARLMQTPLVKLLQPGCRWQFGDPVTCQKDLGPLTVTGTVDSASGVREFTDAARSETAGYFSRGRVTFTSGNNDGISAEIKEHASGGVFTLWPRLPFAIAAGDNYSMTPGCTLRKETSGGTNGCEAWGQLARYGGFPRVPGGDKRSKAATQRAPD
jgi:uncharacterized phage protein (TIGR02218 family)